MRYNVEIDGQRYQVEIIDLQARPITAVVDGERFTVWPEEEKIAPQSDQTTPQVAVPADAPTVKAPLPSTASAGGNELTAPLPGVIVAILVQPGDTVSRGQELVTLEAMKMKNAIKSQWDGTIASVAVSVGDQVAHGQTLVTFKA
jgi:biotin carboxyl carrier protein